MVKVGNKYKERLPFSNKRYWNYTYIVTKIENGFAVCNRIYPNGKTEEVNISLKLLDDDNVILYEKVN